MIDLTKVINENTFIISDSHLGHARVLQFEPVRVEYLSDYNSNVTAECQEFLSLLESTPSEERFQNKRLNELCKALIPHHDEMLIEKWNSVVGKDDTVFHLGDFAFHNIENYTASLNGKKILMRGNHDMKSSQHYAECGWAEIIESVKLSMGGRMFEIIPHTDRYWNAFLTTINNHKIMFSHYPIFNNNEWDLKKYGDITNMLEKVYEGYGATLNFHGHVHSKNSEFCRAVNVSTERCTGLKPQTIGDILKLNA